VTSLADPATGSAGGAPERALAALSASHLRACASLLLLCLVCFLPGFASLQPMDRDEPRFAQATKQMLETGDLVDIRFQGEARHKKPVGIYWAQALAVSAGEALGVPQARRTIALYRIPSLIGASAAVLLAYWTALAFLGRRGALLAAALFGACLMLSAEARLAKTDALLCACTTATLGALARLWLRRGEADPLGHGGRLALWGGMALGILVKGPMVPFFAGLPALALCLHARDWRWLRPARPLPGLALVVAVVAPWFLAIAWKSGGAFFAEAVGKDMMGKVGGGAEKHFAPPGAYLAAFFGTFWPGAAFAALSVPFAWRARRSDPVAFLLAWIVPAWIILELVPTKLPHYVLPLMPAVAILAVLALREGALTPQRRGARWVALLVPAIPAGLAIGLAVAAWRLDGALPVAGPVLLLAASAVAVLSWRSLSTGAAERAMTLAVLAALLVPGAVFGLTQAHLPALKVSPRLAALRDALPCRDPLVASLGYREPSLVFLVGTDLAMLNDGPEAVAFLRGGGCRLVFVESRFQVGYDAAAQAAGAGPREVGTVSGFNINGGRPLSFRAYATIPEAPGR